MSDLGDVSEPFHSSGDTHEASQLCNDGEGDTTMFTKTSIALVFAIAAASAALPLTSSPASADICFARSPTGAVGWGRGDLDFAREAALAECAIRTPTYSYCRITSCSY
jgi:hypothetical protein